MLNFLNLLVVSIITLLQSADAFPLLFGSVGRELTPAELAQVEELTQHTGGRPWLVIGFPSMLLGRGTITVYLRTESGTNRLRRGRVLQLIADEPPVVPSRSDWRIESSSSYAHIVLLGRNADDITGDWDIGWPFIVDGEPDDETLFSLVAFIRSKPEVPVPEGSAPRHVDGMWPISGVRRTGDRFVVTLRTGEAKGQTVTLGRIGRQWVITDYSFWII